ncbi:MAG: tol-pal system YbgF family protein, partial [Gemmataceae bacterium]
WIAVLLLTFTPSFARAQDGPPPAAPAPAPGPGAAPYAPPSDIEMVERLLAARRDYQAVLERLRTHYIKTGDVERAKWAEEELLQFHRISKRAYRLELDVPPPTLQAAYNVPAANELYMRAMSYKDKGWGQDYTDNQRRAEILFQQILTSYPQCDKIDDAAYQLGEIYESKAYKQYRRAASYYERCVQWNPNTQFDARLKAARLYDRVLSERQKAVDLYRQILTHSTDPKVIAEAQKRLADLAGPVK